eukprot:g18059.t1
MTPEAGMMNHFLTLFHPEIVYEAEIAEKKEFLICVVSQALSRGMVFAGGSYAHERPAFPRLLEADLSFGASDEEEVQAAMKEEEDGEKNKGTTDEKQDDGGNVEKKKAAASSASAALEMASVEPTGQDRNPTELAAAASPGATSSMELRAAGTLQIGGSSSSAAAATFGASGELESTGPTSPFSTKSEHEEVKVDFNDPGISEELHDRAIGLLPRSIQIPVFTSKDERPNLYVRYSSFSKNDMLAIRQASAMGEVTVDMSAIDGMWLRRTVLVVFFFYVIFWFYGRGRRRRAEGGKAQATAGEKALVVFQGKLVSLHDRGEDSSASEDEEEDKRQALRVTLTDDKDAMQRESGGEKSEAQEVGGGDDSAKQGEVGGGGEVEQDVEFEPEGDAALKLYRVLHHKYFIMLELFVLLLYLGMWAYATQVKFRLDFWARNSMLISMRESCLGVAQKDWIPNTTCEANMFVKYSIDTYLLNYAHTLQILVKYRFCGAIVLSFFSLVWVLRLVAAKGDLDVLAMEEEDLMYARIAAGTLQADKDGRPILPKIRQEDRRILVTLRNYLCHDLFALTELVFGIFGGWACLFFPNAPDSPTENLIFWLMKHALRLPVQDYALCWTLWIFLFRPVFELSEYRLFLHVMSHTIRTRKAILKVFLIALLGSLLLHTALGMWLQRLQVPYNLADESDLLEPVFSRGQGSDAYKSGQDYEGPVRDETGRYLRHVENTVESLGGAMHYALTMVIGIGPPDPNMAWNAVSTFFWLLCFLHAGCYFGFLGAILDDALSHMHDTVAELLGEEDVDVLETVAIVPLARSGRVVESVRDEFKQDGYKEPDETETLAVLTFLDQPVLNTAIQLLSFVPLAFLTKSLQYEEFPNNMTFLGFLIFKDDAASTTFLVAICADALFSVFALLEFVAVLSRCQKAARDWEAKQLRRGTAGGKRIGAAKYPLTFLGFCDMVSFVLPLLALCLWVFQGTDLLMYPGPRKQPDDKAKLYFLTYVDMPPSMDPTDVYYRCGYACQLLAPFTAELRQTIFVTLLVLGRMGNIFKPTRYYNTINAIYTGVYNNRHVIIFAYVLTSLFAVFGASLLYMTSYDAFLPEEQFDVNTWQMAFWEMFQKMSGLESGSQHQVWGWQVFLSTFGQILMSLPFGIFVSAFDLSVDENGIADIGMDSSSSSDEDVEDDQKDNDQDDDKAKGSKDKEPAEMEEEEPPDPMSLISNEEWLALHARTGGFVRGCVHTYFEDQHGPGKWYYYVGIL